MRLRPLDRGSNVGNLIGTTHVRLQPVVRADAHLPAADEMADQRPRFTVLAPRPEAASVEVHDDRCAGRPVTAAVDIQGAVPPLAVGEVPRPRDDTAHRRQRS